MGGAGTRLIAAQPGPSRQMTHTAPPPRTTAMEHTTTTIDTLAAEVEALEAEWAATDARLEALLARPVHRSIGSQLAALRQLATENSAALDAIEAEQAVIAAQLDELERSP